LVVHVDAEAGASRRANGPRRTNVPERPRARRRSSASRTWRAPARPDHPGGVPGRRDPRRRVRAVGAAEGAGGAGSSRPGAPREGPPDDRARRGFASIPTHSRRIVTVSYSERRVRGTPSLGSPGQPLVEEGDVPPLRPADGITL